MGRLRIYNTLSEKTEVFRSISPGSVKMLVCGPTIQDYIHMGHARTYLFYDVLARYLAYSGNRVKFVVNITDIDEGIVKGAEKEGTEIVEFTSKYEREFLVDMGRLGIVSVSSYERVSKHLPEMISQVTGLVRKGHGYMVGDSVFFSIDSFPRFGRLSRQSRHQLSLRPLEVAEGKKNQADFSLWRSTKAPEQRWGSPWGMGTPGWHIQDTAVSSALLGSQYDIHGGARELVYPHHEAQIAEMESLHGVHPFVRFWVHSGLLTQSREKIAKSRGNAVHARDLLKDYGEGAVRMYMLGMHHRKDVEFSEKALGERGEAFVSLREDSKKIRGRNRVFGAGAVDRDDPFFLAMDDDMHTDRAIQHLQRTVRETARSRSGKDDAKVLEVLGAASKILGLGLLD